MLRMSMSDFVRQQGFNDVEQASCSQQYRALMFQPRLLTILILIGLALQSWEVLLGLSAILWWNVLVPTRNPFDVLYNHFFAAPRSLPPLGLAPAPRRFAQGMAAAYMLALVATMLLDWQLTAWVLEGFLVVQLAALIFWNFCPGARIFHSLAQSRPPRAQSAHH